MASTPNFQIPYPGSLDDENNVPRAMELLAMGVDDELKALRDGWREPWRPYSVTWQGTGNLSIGNGTLSGVYLQLGRVCFYEILMVRGSTSNVGTGLWQFSLPMPQSEWRRVSGHGYFRRGTDTRALTAVGIGTGSIGLALHDGRVSNVRPGGWAAEDELFVSGFYRVPGASV